MQIKIEDKSSIKKVLSIEIPKEDITAELDKAYSELSKNVELKGFRKGKIPRKVLENRFSKNVLADLKSKLIQTSFAEAVEQLNLPVIGTPLSDPPDIEPDKTYVVDITVEVKPELDDIEIEGIALKKTKYEVFDEQIESQLYMIQKTLAKKETISEARPVKENDFVLIDYEGFLDGEPYGKTPKIENYMMGIGQNEMPKEFAEKLIGSIPVQDLEIEVAYDENHAFDDLKGKTILYKVKLKEIKEEILPELNDEMARELGKYQTLEELKTVIRKDLKTSYAARVRHELAEQIFQHLLDKCEFEVPNAFIEGEINDIIMETERAYASNNMKLEDTGLSRDALRTQYREVAEKQARRHMILDKIIIQEKLELSDEEMNEGFAKMALQMNSSMEAVKDFFNQEQNQNQLINYKYTQLAAKAIDIIIDKGHITEVEPGDEVEPEPESENAQVEGEGVSEDSTDEKSSLSDNL
jgi:trigger factor